MKKTYLHRTIHILMTVVLLAAFIPQRTAYAAASLTIEPITWNVVGLDSNLVTTGPNNFPVGVRVCNTSATEVANDVRTTFVWDTTDAFINLRPGSYDSPTGTLYPTIDLAPSACQDFYYEVTITRDDDAYDHTARYHITADGSDTDPVSTPTRREIYVEHLISQSRNYTYTVFLGDKEIPAGGTMDLMVGNTYDITLEASTATNGYEQIESFINFKNTIFRINTVETTYTAFDVTTPDPDADNKLYADGCGWVNNLLSPNYRSCLATGKYGGEVTVKYNVTIIGGAGSSETLSNLIYDFSGSSYHYNADLDDSPRIAIIYGPESIAISKSFAPPNITPGGVSRLMIVISNPIDEPISGVNFTDTLPTAPDQMLVADPADAVTLGCGTPTFSPAANDASISFSNGTIAGNGTCTIQVNVTAPTASETTYVNTTNELFINGTTPTGKFASASLLVTDKVLPELPLTCASPVQMASWDMESGLGANGSPLVTSTQADVATALTSYYTQAGAQVVDIPKAYTSNAWGGTAPTDSDGDGDLDSGWIETATSMQNYFQFVLDTSNYNGVYVIFDANPFNPGDWANPNSNVFVHTSTDGVTFSPYYPTPITPKGNWSTNIVAIANLTSAANTTIRFGVDGSNKPASTFYMDNVTFWGCPSPTPLTAPTVTKAFSPTTVAVVDGTSTLTLTITNPGIAGSTLSGVSINDFLPRETLGGTVYVTDGSTEVTGTGTQFTSALLPGSIVTIPAAPVAISGTLAGTNGNAAITGTGTSFTTELVAGDTLVINSVSYQVLAIVDDFTLTLATPYRGTNTAGQNGSTYHSYTVASVTDDTTLTLSTNYAGSTGTTTIASGLTIAGAPSTTCGSPVVGVTGGSALTLTGAPLTGTIAVNNGSASVTGSGTAFSSQIGAGRIIRLPFQLTGTVAATTGSFTITGTGTTFNTQIAVGDTIRISGVDYYVSARASNTLLTLATPFRGTTATGLTAQGYRNYTVQSVSSNTSLTLTTNYSSAAALSGYTATAGLAGGSTGNTCTVTVPVKANRAGTHNNTTGLITSKESGENTTTAGYASAALAAVMPPIIAKKFTTNPLVVGEITTLTFTILNPNPAYAMTGVAFTDDLPAGMTIATPANASTSGCGTPTWNTTDPLSFSGGTIAAGGTCSAVVDITAAVIGNYVNTSGNVSHTVNAATINGNKATDTLVVRAGIPALSIRKQVGATAAGFWYDSTIIVAGANVYYRIIVENTGEVDLTNVTVKDPPGGATVCTIASLPAPDAANENHISYCPLGPTPASAGIVTNTAQANAGATFSNLDSASYLNGNFGHLPSAYLNMNLYNDGGAMHLNGSTYLGASVTTNATDGINTATYTPKATDNGITWINAWNDGSGEASVNATCSTPGTRTLVGWFDWNNDFDFDDAGETGTWTVDCDSDGAITTITGLDYPGTGNIAKGLYYTRFRIYETTPVDPKPYGMVSIVGEIEDPFIRSDGNGTHSPVTVAFFRAQRHGGEVTFEWSTATETGNAGFHLYVEDAGGLTRINPELIASSVVDSLEPQDYTYTGTTAGNIFYIEDVSIAGETRLHGPFHLGQPYGERLVAEPIDWNALQRQDKALRVGQQNELRSELSVPAAALEPAKTGVGGMQLGVSLNLLVDQTGIYRVTYDQLKEAGLDLRNVPLRKVTITHLGKSVPVYAVGQAKFGPGAYIEFYGEALDTLYTDTNIYTIQVSRSAADQVQANSGSPAKGLTPATTYTETLLVNRQRSRSDGAPGTDAWFDTSMLVYKTSKSWNFTFQVDDLVSAPASMDVVVWGVTDWPASPDHHLIVSVNGAAVAETIFDGRGEKHVQFTLPAGALHEGSNTLTLTLPGDTGVSWDIIALDSYRLTYQRELAARDGRLVFNANAKVFQVTNLPDKNVVVYRMTDGNLVRLNQVKVLLADDGTYTATFAGANGAATYFVTTIAGMHQAELQPVRLQADLDQPADYLVIAHPNYIAGIQPLVAARQAQGYTVSVVDVNDIYTQYSYGIFDPQAIKDYIAHAYHDLGTKYVLLVGGDTYDYRNYLGLNSISYIPSLYVSTGAIAHFVPVDPLYADVDGDNVPDLAIGRFPVRSTAELDMVVQKTLAYEDKDYGQTAFFASDRFEAEENFKMISDTMALSLPAGWDVESAHLDDLSVTEARKRLLAAMNRGTALVTFTGHSGPTTWTFNDLFSNKYAAALTNAGKPFVAVQWGCWNTYIVDPVNANLAQKLLFSGDRGAAAVLGATTLTHSTSEEALGVFLTPRLTTPGMTIGDALLLAKQELAQTNPELLDVLLGWTLMGDPALMIAP